MRTVVGLLALGVVLAVSSTPAWSGTTCPAGRVSSVDAPSGDGACGEEAGEVELEQKEDEEEEQAIAAERAAASAKDAGEEDAEEAGESTHSGTAVGGSVSHSSGPGRTAKLTFFRIWRPVCIGAGMRSAGGR